MPLLACPAVRVSSRGKALLDKPAVAPFRSTRHSKFDKALGYRWPETPAKSDPPLAKRRANGFARLR